jgi:steroid delta-isomerase-like uncharacterized protein
MKSSYQLIESYYQAFNTKDFATMLSYLDQKVVHDINQGERQVGIDKFRSFMDSMNHHYEEQLTDLVIMVAKDERRAACEFICHGTYLVTAPGLPEAKKQTYKLPVGAFFEIAAGKITRITNYYNLQDWISQVLHK